jgi:sugar lactone lactonase YvrE
MAFDKDKNMYISQFIASTIYKVTPSGSVSYFAGSGTQGSSDGVGIAASFAYPHGLVFDKAGNLFVTDWYNNTIRKITPSAQVTTFAGSGAIGAANGKGRNASFNNPDGIAIDKNGNLYIADSVNNMIRMIDATGKVTTYAGTGAIGNKDGTPDKSSFSFPTGVTVDGKGMVYVADQGNKLIRKIGLQ